MALIEAKNVSIHFGGSPILEGLDCKVEPGDKIGLIGRNGAGKSTLIRILSGAMEPDSGKILRPGELRVAVVAQTVNEAELGLSVRDFVLNDVARAEARVRALEEQMAQGEGEGLETILALYARATEALEAAGGVEAYDDLANNLERVAIDPKAAHRPLSSFSGGEINRIQLARAMVSRPDLLILDEPGNHLDAWCLAWLEGFLQGHKAASLRSALVQAEGARADAAHIARLKARETYLAQLAKAVADPATGRRLRALRSQIAVTEDRARERPELDNATAAMNLVGTSSKSDTALLLSGYSLSVAGKSLFSQADAHLATGRRVALVGPNGAGKTSLLKDLLARGAWDNSDLRLGPSMKLAYCSQSQDSMDKQRSVADTILNAKPMERGALIPFAAREALERALEDFVGTLLVVSHDRFFLQQLVDQVWFLHQGRLEPFDGNYYQWWREVGSRILPQNFTHDKARSSAPTPKQQRPQRGGAPGQGSIEDRLMGLEEEKRRLTVAIESAYGKNDLQEVRKLSGQLDKVSREFDWVYALWS